MKKALLDSVKKVHELFKTRKLSLSVAESCTGGLIGHCLTCLPGASEFFVADVVSYSEESKKYILGISPEIISNYGVVSKETAEEMARRVRLVSRTDFSVSTTGNLGPDVLEGKERGLVYIAASKEDGTVSEKLNLQGERNENKEQASLEALRFLIKFVEGERYKNVTR